MQKIRDYLAVDESDYDPEKSCNGGRYRFTTKLQYDAERNAYVVTYDASAEFSYCRIYGTFSECHRCCEYENGECVAEPEIMSVDAAEAFMDYMDEREGCYVELLDI